MTSPAGTPPSAPARVGADATRQRVLEAALVCVERQGLAKTSLENVAAEAGLSRATLYRYFPGGRDQVISDTVTWEVRNFLDRIRAATADDHDIEARLTHALLAGHRAIDEHTLLQQILSTEPEALLKELAANGPVMMHEIRAALAADLAGATLRPGVDPDEAADYLARLFLSHIGSRGRWDPDDAASTARLVRTQFLAGIVAS